MSHRNATIRCALCGREGVASFEVMMAATLEGVGGSVLIGGEPVEVPAGTIVPVYVCAARAACRRRRGLRP